MERLRICGGHPLNGIIPVSGMKNSALPILFACALNNETCVIQNVPDVKDVVTTVRILRAMGVSIVYRSRTELEVNGSGFRPMTSPNDLVASIRASSYLIGVELARCGQTKILFPGGCNFGSRPLDYHTKAFESMGAEMTTREYVSGVAPNGLHDAKIMLDSPSVGATINIMLAASLIPNGVTIVNNAAREPHVVDLAMFLNECGASVRGAGTSEIKICGVEKLHGCKHTIIPDMIEAGTYMVAVAACGGEVKLTNVVSKHLEAVSSKLTDMGARVTESTDGNTISVSSDGGASLKCVNIKTDVYPGFPTDMHPQFVPLLCMARGNSILTETIWTRRFQYLTELAKMGTVFSHSDSDTSATFFGCQNLQGATVSATDLRGGAALVIAALVAEGETFIINPEYIDRGYNDLIEKLRHVGADIERVSVIVPSEQTVTSSLS